MRVTGGSLQRRGVRKNSRGGGASDGPVVCIDLFKAPATASLIFEALPEVLLHGLLFRKGRDLGAKKRIMLSAHWDTRPFADQGVDESAHVLTVQLWQDQTLVQTYFRQNPLVVHAPLSENGDASEHHTEQLSTSLYHLRVPEHLGVNRVTVSAPTDTDQVHSRSLHKNTESLLIDFHF